MIIIIASKRCSGQTWQCAVLNKKIQKWTKRIFFEVWVKLKVHSNIKMCEFLNYQHFIWQIFAIWINVYHWNFVADSRKEYIDLSAKNEDYIFHPLILLLRFCTSVQIKFEMNNCRVLRLFFDIFITREYIHRNQQKR